MVPQHVKKSINMSNMPLNLHLKSSIHVGGFQFFFTTSLTIILRQFSIAVFTFKRQRQKCNECIWADLKTRPLSSNIDLHLPETLFKPTVEGKVQEHPRKYSNLTQLRDQLFQSQGFGVLPPFFSGHRSVRRRIQKPSNRGAHAHLQIMHRPTNQAHFDLGEG